MISCSFWNAEQNLHRCEKLILCSCIFNVKRVEIFKFSFLQKKCFFFPLVEFSNLFSKNVDDTFRVLEEINWNPRAVNSYPFIHHSADNFTGCLLLVYALMSFEFFIWSSWLFSKILNTIVLDNVMMLVEGNFNEFNELI